MKARVNKTNQSPLNFYQSRARLPAEVRQLGQVYYLKFPVMAFIELAFPGFQPVAGDIFLFYLYRNRLK
jgi:hypothetical protein